MPRGKREKTPSEESGSGKTYGDELKEKTPEELQKMVKQLRTQLTGVQCTLETTERQLKIQKKEKTAASRQVTNLIQQLANLRKEVDGLSGPADTPAARSRTCAQVLRADYDKLHSGVNEAISKMDAEILPADDQVFLRKLPRMLESLAKKIQKKC